jgi:hypothetical protein
MSDMTARPVSRRSPFARAVYLHLGVDLFGQLHAEKPGEAMQQDGDIRRLPACLSVITVTKSLLEFIHLATRPNDKRREVRRFTKRGVAPFADGLAGFAIHRFHLDVIPAGAEYRNPGASGAAVAIGFRACGAARLHPE